MIKESLEKRVYEQGLALVESWRMQGHWADGRTLLDGLLPVAQRLGAAAEATIWLQNGRILADEGTFGGRDTLAQRESALEKAVALAERVDNPTLLGDVYDALGRSRHAAYLNSDRSQEPEDELALFEKGLALRQEGGDAAKIAESRFHIGLVHDVIRREYAEGLQHHRQAYELACEAGDKLTASYAIRHMGFAYWMTEEKTAALAAFDESYSLRQEIGFVPGTAFALVTLAQVDAELGKREQARARFLQAKQMLCALDAAPRVVWIEGHLAKLEGQTA